MLGALVNFYWLFPVRPWRQPYVADTISAANTSLQMKIKLTFNNHIGQWSDVVSIPVAG
jgi:hypothetical protein